MSTSKTRRSGPALLRIALLAAAFCASTPAAASAAWKIPHSPVNAMIAENTHQTYQTFVEVRDILKTLLRDYHTIRTTTETGVRDAVDQFRAGDLDAGSLTVQVRVLIRRMISQLKARVRDCHWDMDETVVIAEELIDTNLRLARKVPGVRDSLHHLLSLRDTKNGQLDALLADLTRQCRTVTEQKLQLVLEVQHNVDQVEAVIMQLLDDVRAAIHLNMAQSHVHMAELEHQFRAVSLRVTLAEKAAFEARRR